MSRKIIIQDITTITKGTIVHQVNCQGVMGGGVAAGIRKKFQKAYDDYDALCKKYNGDDRWKLLGQTQVVEINKGLSVANAFGQLDCSTGSRETEYHALHTALYALVVTEVRPSGPIYIPYNIGCGLGGGEWNIVKSIIGEVASQSAEEVILCAWNPAAVSFIEDLWNDAGKKRFALRSDFDTWLNKHDADLAALPLRYIHTGQIKDLVWQIQNNPKHQNYKKKAKK